MDYSAKRADIQRRLFERMALVMTVKQHARFVTAVDGLSDVDFFQMLAALARKSEDGTPFSAKDEALYVSEVQRKIARSGETLAANVQPIVFLPEELNQALAEPIGASWPSDVIRLTRESDKMLMGLWEDADKSIAENGGVTIPVDLFFTGTVPLMDCMISVDETMDGGVVNSFRIVIFDGYAEKLRVATEGEAVKVGAIITEDARTGTALVLPINVILGIDKVLFGACGYRGMSDGLREYLSEHVDSGTVRGLHLACLETWYGIQIALLHPVVRDVFQNPRTIRDKTKDRWAAPARRNRVRYVREHVVNEEALGKAIYGDEDGNGKDFVRRALIWYVIGHWRTYSDGRRVFVRPYWKGALRDLKASDQLREREIAQIVGAAGGAPFSEVCQRS